MNFKNSILLLFIIIAIGSFLRLYGLSFRPAFFPDEEVYYRTAQYYAFGIINPLYTQLQNGIFIVYFPNHVNYEHPLLGKLIIALGLIIFGDSLYSARLIVALFNIFLIPIVYLIGRKTLNEKKALLLTLLFAIDPLNVALSRTAMLDSLCLFFFILGFFFFLYHHDVRIGYILISIFFALSLAVKLTMLPLILSLIFIGFFYLKRNRMLCITLSFVLTIVTFIITYVPYFYSNYNISMLPPQYKYLDYGSHNFSDFLKLMNWIYLYHFYWHLSNDFYYYIYENPFFYTLYQNGTYQMFNSNPIIILAGIAFLIIFPYYNIFIKKINEHYKLLTILYLPQSLLFFTKGLSWYMVVYNFLSLLIILSISTKNDSVSSILNFMFIFSILESDIAMVAIYFLLQ